MKVLFYSPFSYIRYHSFPEASIIKSLLKNGYEVDRLTCDSFFSSFCFSMETAGLSMTSPENSKSKICDQCSIYSNSINEIPGLKTLFGSNFIDQSLIQRISDFIQLISIENFDLNLNFEGVNLCKEVLYETILKFKLNNLELSNIELPYFKNQLKNSLISYFLAQKVSSILKYDILVMFNIQYSMMNSFYIGFNNKSTKVYTLNGSDNNYYRTGLIRFWDWQKNKLVHPAKFYWENYDMSKLPQISKKIAENHVKALYNASSPNVYSEKKSIFKNNRFFDLTNYKKTALLAMSSFDEAYAAHTIGAYPDWKVQSSIFSSQLEWLKYTVDIFSSHPDYCLIIRVHPREFMNKRQSKMSKIVNSSDDKTSVISKHIGEIRDYLDNTKLPKNIIINYPNQKVSIYDLFEEIDLVISNTSTTVIESLYNNINVVVYDNNMTNYPDDIVINGQNKFEYRDNILNTLKSSSIPELRSKALNWWGYKHYVGNLMIRPTLVSSIYYKALVKILLKFNLKILLKIINKFELEKFTLEESSESKLMELLNSEYSNLYDPRLSSNKNILK